MNTTTKYFAGTQEVIFPEPMRNADFHKRFGFVLVPARYDDCSKLVGVPTNAVYKSRKEQEATFVPVTRIIYRKANPSMHKCDARCQSAKGRNCECSCGGQFHGSAA